MTIVPGTKSAAADLDVVVQTLNGSVTTLSVPTFANRLSATVPGAQATSGYVGAVATPAPFGFVTALSPVGGTFVKGDFVIDQAGLIWLATASTSGTTPWVAVGHGGDNVRSRQTITSGVSGSAYNGWLGWGGFDFGGIHYEFGPLAGFIFQTAGYYQITSTVKVTNMGSAGSFTLGWTRGFAGFPQPPVLPIQPASFFSLGDLGKGGGNASGDAGSFIDDIAFFAAGDHIQTYALYTGPNSNVGSSSGTSDATLYATVQLLSASAST